MTDNYLKTVRANGTQSDLSTSEAELTQMNEGLHDCFQALMSLRSAVNLEKLTSLTDIDKKHHTKLKELEAQYAMMLALSR